MATDPVCGMNVTPGREKAIRDYDGQRYYFCSTGCAEKFSRDPARYAAKGAGAAAAKEVHKDTSADNRTYTCPMHPEVRQIGPGNCPKCGMALEPIEVEQPKDKVEYVCPMHPQIVRDKPGNCPICGMALEPRTVSAGEEVNPELIDMTRRFWISVVLTAPLIVLAMARHLPGNPIAHLLRPGLFNWVELVLATPVVLWGGWPFFVRGWLSIVNRHLNMFTLIALGVGVSFVFSIVATRGGSLL